MKLRNEALKDKVVKIRGEYQELCYILEICKTKSQNKFTCYLSLLSVLPKS